MAYMKTYPMQSPTVDCARPSSRCAAGVMSTTATVLGTAEMVVAAKARRLSANKIAKTGPKLQTVKMFEISRLSQRSNVSSPALCSLAIVHISYALLVAASSTMYIVMHERIFSRQGRRTWS